MGRWIQGGGFPAAEAKQDLAEAFANLNESAEKKPRLSSRFPFDVLCRNVCSLTRRSDPFEGYRDIFATRRADKLNCARV